MRKSIPQYSTIRRLPLMRHVEKLIGKSLRIKISNGPTRAIICLCPYHYEKNPSFRMWIDGRFYCFGCGRSGDWIQLVEDFYKPTDDHELIQFAQKYFRIRNQPTFRF